MRWFRRAAEQGHDRAQSILATALGMGLGVPKDVVQAVQWGLRAARQGNINAQCNLGTIYGKGAGVPKSGVEAVRWFRAAAEQGYGPAQISLASMLINGGDGLEKDEEEGAHWYREATRNCLGAQAQLAGPLFSWPLCFVHHAANALYFSKSYGRLLEGKQCTPALRVDAIRHHTHAKYTMIRSNFNYFDV